MERVFDEELKEFRDHIARWAETRLAPRAEELDQSGEFARDLFEELAALGYLGIMYPEKYGGAGMKSRNLAYTIMCEELARACMGFAATVCMHGSTATHTIFEWGSEALRQEYLVPALKGQKVGAFAITEPNAGSDAASLRTRATRNDDGYVLNGTKMFISNGAIADFITVAATTDPSRGLKGIALFLVDAASPGLTVSRKLDKFTTHCSDSTELAFEDVAVPEGHRLGGEEGGFLNAYKALTVDRIFTAALGLGAARAAYDGARTYAGEREQFGQPIGKFQAVQFKLVDMLAVLEQTRLYTYYAAAMADRGQSITVEAALAKIVAADGANEICQKALNIFGGYGLMNEFPIQRHLRDSYFPMIGGGTSDIMRMLIARQIGF